MLISESHNFIFIHIYKNAGTSIKVALKPFATSIFQQKLSRVTHIPFLKPLALLSMRFDRFNPTPYQSHISAQQIATELGDSYYSYFSFAFVRNPWDWQVSLYNYMLKNNNHYQHELVKELGSFEAYLRWRCTEEVRYQRDFIYSDTGELLVDFIGRFEQIEQDFHIISSRIGISTTLPKTNISTIGSYKDYYNRESVALVSKVFEPDISTFGYSFF